MRRRVTWSIVFAAILWFTWSGMGQPRKSGGQNSIRTGLPRIAQMADAALTAAHPELRRNLGFVEGKFSPDGSEFAFGLTIRSADAEEIWLYDLDSERLRRVTDAGGREVWSTSGKLYVSSDRKRYTMATPDSISETGQPPPDVANAIERAEPGSGDVRQLGEYSVSAENQGHGFFSLFIFAPGKPRHVIAKGGWELESFLLNAARRQVLYRGGTDWSGTIVAYNLRTGQKETLDDQAGQSVRLLDLSTGGNRIAYSKRGPCGPDTTSIGNRAELRAANICFFRP